MYVVAKDASRNRVVVGVHGDLAVRRVELERARLYRDGGRVDRVRLRYRSRPVPCSLQHAPGRGEHAALTITLNEPVHGVAAGQTACLMDGNMVIGCGTIA
jgi:tRNA-specific 2-thiouridylase